MSLLRPQLPWIGFLALLAASGCASPSSAQSERTVPPPFTPLETAAGPPIVVRAWGREYRFEAGPLPTRIRSQGTDLWAAPPSFRLASGEALEAVVWEPPLLLEATASAAALRSVGSAAGLRVEATTRVEYDGMVEVQWSVHAGASVVLTRAELELDIPHEVARLFHHHLPYDPKRANVQKGRLTQVAGRIDRSVRQLPFTPSFSLGNRNVGIEWWSESDAGWTGLPTPISVDASGASVRFRVRPVHRRVELGAGSFEDRFAVFALPLRPAAFDGRTIRFASHTAAPSFAPPEGSRHVFVAFPSAFEARWYGHPGSVPGAAQTALRAKMASRGVDYVPYAKLQVVANRHPHALARQSDWSADGRPWRGRPPADELRLLQKRDPEFEVGMPYAYAACAGREDYFDWWLGEVERVFREERTDGLYFDFGGITRMCTRSPRLRGREGRQVWEYFAVRRFYRRLYERMKAARPDALLLIHTHGHPRALGAFVDFHFVGESLSEQFRHRDLDGTRRYEPDYHALPDGFLEAHFFPPVGGTTSLIPQIKHASADRVARDQRALYSLLLPMGAHSPLWVSDWETARDVQRAIDRFGRLDGTAFEPAGKHVGIEADARLAVAAHRGPDRLLLIVSNPEDGALAGSVRVEGAKAVQDLESESSLSVDAERFELRVPPRDFRLLEVELR